MGCGPVDCVVKKNQTLVLQPMELPDQPVELEQTTQQLNIQSDLIQSENAEPLMIDLRTTYMQQNNDLDQGCAKNWINTPEPPVNPNDDDDTEIIQKVEYFSLMPDPLPPIVLKQELKSAKLPQISSSQQPLITTQNASIQYSEQELPQQNTLSETANPSPQRKKRRIKRKLSKVYDIDHKLSDEHDEHEYHEDSELDHSAQQVNPVENDENDPINHVENDDIKASSNAENSHPNHNENDHAEPQNNAEIDPVDVYVDEKSEESQIETVAVPLTQGKELAEIEQNDPVDEYVEDNIQDNESDLEHLEQPLTQGIELAEIEKNDPIDEYVSEGSEKNEVEIEAVEEPLVQGKELAEIEKNDPVDEYVEEKSDKKEVSDVQDYDKELQQGKQFNELERSEKEADNLKVETEGEEMIQ